MTHVNFSYELTFHKKKEKEEPCFNCFALFGARHQCVLRWESLNSCKATTRSSAGGKSSAIESLCVYAITTVKRTWERGWSSPLCIIFFRFRHRAYFTDGRKTTLPQPKQKHMQGALSKRSMYLGDRNPILDRLTWYYSKKYELNVAMADIRHGWFLSVFCIQPGKGAFLVIFLLQCTTMTWVHDFCVHDRALQTSSYTRKFVPAWRGI